MPIYEYKCRTCGREFEYKQRITEDSLQFCPPEICEIEEKGKGIVERMISKNIGLVFKGSGFYVTDYVHKKESPSNYSSDIKKTETKNEEKQTSQNIPTEKSESQTTIKDNKLISENSAIKSGSGQTNNNTGQEKK